MEEVSVLRIRIKFAKRGYMKFIGHLDTMRYFQKVMRRADVDMMYSEGFNPHQKMSFAAPLGVGRTSEGEYMDIEVKSTLDSNTMLERINAQMVEGMEVLSYRLLPDDGKKAMSIVAAADYIVNFRDGYGLDINLEEKFNDYISKEEILVLKKTKKSEKEVNIKSGIFKAYVQGDKIFMMLSSSSAEYLKPELVMKGFYDYLGIEMPEFAVEVQRTEVYAFADENATVLEDRFVTLEDLGNEIIEAIEG